MQKEDDFNIENLYKLDIQIKNSKNIKPNYYGVLGSITNIFGGELYDSIISISPLHKLNDKTYLITITLLGLDKFLFVTNEVFKDKKEININGEKLEISGVSYDFKIYDKSKILYKDFDDINIRFMSPTYIKKTLDDTDINQLLPSPEIYLLSAMRKYYKYINLEFNERDIREHIIKNIIVISFDIHTKLFEIKKNKKAGVVGNIKYKFVGKDIKYKQNLYFALRYAIFAGIGTGAKLGLGQCKIYFN